MICNSHKSNRLASNVCYHLNGAAIVASRIFHILSQLSNTLTFLVASTSFADTLAACYRSLTLSLSLSFFFRLFDFSHSHGSFSLIEQIQTVYVPCPSFFHACSITSDSYNVHTNWRNHLIRIWEIQANTGKICKIQTILTNNFKIGLLI